jgi:hypothetical protein
MLIGAVTGIVGSVVGRVGNYIDKKQEIAAEERRRADDLELAKLRISSEKEIAEIKSFSELRATSYTHDSSFGEGSKWVVNIQKLVRPILTYYALILETILWFTVTDPTTKALIAAAVLETVSLTVSWWFGDRALSKITKST